MLLLQTLNTTVIWQGQAITSISANDVVRLCRQHWISMYYAKIEDQINGHLNRHQLVNMFYGTEVRGVTISFPLRTAWQAEMEFQNQVERHLSDPANGAKIQQEGVILEGGIDGIRTIRWARSYIHPYDPNLPPRPPLGLGVNDIHPNALHLDVNGSGPRR